MKETFRTSALKQNCSSDKVRGERARLVPGELVALLDDDARAAETLLCKDLAVVPDCVMLGHGHAAELQKIEVHFFRASTDD